MSEVTVRRVFWCDSHSHYPNLCWISSEHLKISHVKDPGAEYFLPTLKVLQVIPGAHKAGPPTDDRE